MPEGYKHFSKTKPMKLEHFQPVMDWWQSRTEIDKVLEEITARLNEIEAKLT